MKAKFVVGIAVIIAFSGFAFYSFHSALNPYVSFLDARSTAGTVQVIGHLVDGSVGYDSGNSQLLFHMEDEEGTVALVAYSGSKPANMEQSESIVAVGQFEDDHFIAKKLLVKCPSKYEEDENKEVK